MKYVYKQSDLNSVIYQLCYQNPIHSRREISQDTHRQIDTQTDAQTDRQLKVKRVTVTQTVTMNCPIWNIQIRCTENEMKIKSAI